MNQVDDKLNAIIAKTFATENNQTNNYESNLQQRRLNNNDINNEEISQIIRFDQIKYQMNNYVSIFPKLFIIRYHL